MPKAYATNRPIQPQRLRSGTGQPAGSFPPASNNIFVLSEGFASLGEGIAGKSERIADRGEGFAKGGGGVTGVGNALAQACEGFSRPFKSYFTPITSLLTRYLRSSRTSTYQTVALLGGAAPWIFWPSTFSGIVFHARVLFCGCGPVV